MKNIKVKKLTEKDLPHRVKWFNNPEVNKYIGDILGEETTLKKQKEWFVNHEKDKNKKFFVIYDDIKPIGLTGLSNINKHNKNADLFVAIGEDEYRGKGFGKEAVKWIVDYSFNKLKLHKVNLGVVKNNKPAVNLYKSLGFIVEGEMRDEIFSNGKFHNFLSMAIFNKNEK